MGAHMENRLELLIVEDDQFACDNLQRAVDDNPDDFYVIETTNNSKNAYKIVCEMHPDVVILDLELHRGGGDGLDFLKRLNQSGFERKPFILVTTNNISSITHEAARQLGADFIMTKCQDNYSAKSVLEFLKNAKSVILNHRPQTLNTENTATPTQKAKRIQHRICTELNKIGISPKAVGYQYLIDAITIAIQELPPNICNIIGVKYKKTGSSVERAMQNAINRAWQTSDINDLLINYTAKIGMDRGAPTITEFICHYAQKIKTDL